MSLLVTDVWGYGGGRPAGERYADSNIGEYDGYGGGSVMVWGGSCLGGRTDLVVIDGGALTASCAVSGWSPWTGGTTLCRSFTAGFCLDARQCPTSHGQSRPSLPGAGRHRRHRSRSGQRDPQTWIRLSICGTSSRDVFQGVRTHRRQYKPSQQPWGRSGMASTRSLYAVWSGACLGDAESVSSSVVVTPVIEVCLVHLICFMGRLKQHGRYCVHCVIALFLGGKLGFANV